MRVRVKSGVAVALLVFVLALIVCVIFFFAFCHSRSHPSPILIQHKKTSSGVIFTCTTWFDAPVGGKWSAFCIGMESLLKNHGGSASQMPLNAWLVINEPRTLGSPDWAALVAAKFPWVTFVQKPKGQHGQARSLNLILEKIKPFRYWLHWEEAWFCKQPFLHKALAVMQDKPDITQLQLTQTPPQTAPNWYHERLLGQDDLGWAYIPSRPEQLTSVTIKDIDMRANSVWPTYSLRPSVNLVSFYSSLPRFSTADSMWPLKFEWEFGRNWVLAGGVKAILIPAPVTRCETHVSTYAPAPQDV